MNIALVHYTAAPIIGGVERVMEEHARIFDGLGHRVTVLCHEGGGADAVRLPREESAEAQLAALRATLAGQDAVFIHNVLTMPFHAGLTEALWRAMDGLPHVRFIAWVHDVAACNPDLAPVAAIFSKAHQRCEYVAVSPLRARQFSEATGTAAARCKVIPNGIEPARVLGLPENVAAFAKEHGLLDGRIVLLHPARLVRRKNVELSIGVGSEFRRRGTPATVLITAADDPHTATAGEFARQLRRSGEAECGHLFVSDHIHVGDEELAALYRLADGLLFPSRSEGFGLPLLEAALHRLPVFCSDIEPLRSLLRENVTLFPPGSEPGHVASLIEGALAASPAFHERKRLLHELSWEAVWRRHLAPLIGSTTA